MNYKYWNNCKTYYDNVLTDLEFDYELVIIEKELTKNGVIRN